MEEDVAVCKDVEEEICQGGVCKTFMKQQCTTEKQTRTKQVPDVQCKQLDTKVCGPEPCPIKSDNVCYDDVKQVSYI